MDYTFILFLFLLYKNIINVCSHKYSNTSLLTFVNKCYIVFFVKIDTLLMEKLIKEESDNVFLVKKLEIWDIKWAKLKYV